MSVCYLHKQMKFLIFIIPIFYMMEYVCPVGSEDVRKASGYLGDQVVLKLNVDPTWKLITIEWSVHTNSTYIATFQDGERRIFRDRLELNTATGDLTITNLMPEDALQYKVYLENMDNVVCTIYFQLSIQEQVSKPQITLMHRFLDAEKCVISLKCSTMNNKVSLSWTLDHPLDVSESFFHDCSLIARESVMWASLGTNREVDFTCTATDGNHNVLSKWHGKCSDSTPIQPQTNCTPGNKTMCSSGRGFGGLIVGVIVGALLMAILVIINFKINGSDLVPLQFRCLKEPTRKEEDVREDENAETEVKLVENEKSDQT